MTKSILLVSAALLASVSAWHHHMRGGGWGGGLMHRIKELLAGGRVIDLREADSCCAMHRDGSYYANVSLIADMGDGPSPQFGSVGMDVPGARYIGFIGDPDEGVEGSDYGVYLRSVNGSADGASLFVATAWCAKAQKCVDHAVPLVPSMCFGDGTLLPDVLSTSRIDAMLSANNFADEDRNHVIAVNRITCMPLYSVHRFDVDRSNPETVWRALLPSRGGGGSSDDETWAVTMFLNATGTPPPDDVFGLPSYCDTDSTRRRLAA